MKKLTLLFTMLLSLFTLYSDISAQPQTLWSSYYNYLNQADRMWDMKMDPDENIYVIANCNNTSGSNIDVSIMRFNSDGSHSWTYTVTDSLNSYDAAVSVNFVNSDNVYAVWNPRWGKIKVEKLDASGSHQWTYTSANEDDRAADAVTNSAGEIFIVGTTRVWENPFLSHYAVLLIKVDPSGNEVFRTEKIAVDSRLRNRCDVNRIIIDTSGDVIAAGYFGNYNPSWETPFAIKFSQSGTDSWTFYEAEDSSASGGNTTTPLDIKLLPDNSFYMIGQYSIDAYVRVISYKISSSGSLQWKNKRDELRMYVGNISIDEENSLYFLTQHNYLTTFHKCLLIKYDQAGNHIFDKEIMKFGLAGTVRNNPFLLVKSSDEIYICGPYDQHGNNNRYNGLVRFDSDGETVWTKIFDPNNTLPIYDATGKLHNSRIFINGSNNIFYGGSVNITQQSGNVVVAKTGPSTTSIENITMETPVNFLLHQNYPNPFNPNTNIKFAIPQTSYVTLEVYNLLGERLDVLVSEELNAGIYNYDWNASGFSSGIYFYKLQAGDFISTKKMILIK